jgi:hypothetical protein
MKIMQSALKIAFLALCCSSAAVHATIMTLDYSEAFSFETNNGIYDYRIGRDREGDNYRTVVRDRQTVNLDRFDGTLGELVGVSIWFETDWNLAGVVKSNHQGSGNATVTGRGRSISRQAVRLIDPNREVERNREVIRNSCVGLNTCSDYDHDSGVFNDEFDLEAFDLSDFIGTDDIEFRVVRTLIADLTHCGPRDYCSQRNKSNDWNGTIFVSYDYDDGEQASVPEPSTLVLLGMGLLGIGATRLGRKAKS